MICIEIEPTIEPKNEPIPVVIPESITKKTVYLNDVCSRLNLDNTAIINERVENLNLKNIDVITARAVASLNVLCGYAARIGDKKTSLLLLKGKTFEKEETEAEKHWSYEKQIFTNQYCADGVIVRIKNLREHK